MPDGVYSVSGQGVGNTASSAKWKMENCKRRFSDCFGKELLMLQGEAFEVLLLEQKTGWSRFLLQPSRLSSAPWWQSLLGTLAKEKRGLQVSGKGEMRGPPSQSHRFILPPWCPLADSIKAMKSRDL